MAIIQSDNINIEYQVQDQLKSILAKVIGKNDYLKKSQVTRMTLSRRSIYNL